LGIFAYRETGLLRSGANSLSDLGRRGIWNVMTMLYAAAVLVMAAGAQRA
jgi:hypothetical protein